MQGIGTITCLICVHSQGDLHDRLLCRALDSVLQQTYRNFEILIVLDECWDKTLTAINSRFNDSMLLHQIRIIYHYEKEGLAACKNFVIPFIKTDWIVFCDADDVCLPDKFEKQVKFLSENPEVDILSTHYWNTRISYIDPFGDPHFFPYDVSCWKTDEYLTHHEIVNKLPQENCLCGASIMMKRSIFDKLKYNDTEEWRGKEDWKMHLDCINAGYRFSQLSSRDYAVTIGTSVKR
jgi:glycosyltransferase involved in cell wall biosynthesis